MTCIITGCAARVGGLVCGGDLHRVGTAYVFNAILDEKGEADWVDASWYEKEVDFSTCEEFFERRGVLIGTIYGAALNEAAKEYLRG